MLEAQKPFEIHDILDLSIDFVNKTIQVNIPDKVGKPELHETVKTFQIHSHSKTCRKYKNKKCRFNFPRFFTAETIIAQPFVRVASEKVNKIPGNFQVFQGNNFYFSRYFSKIVCEKLE